MTYVFGFSSMVSGSSSLAFYPEFLKLPKAGYRAGRKEIQTLIPEGPAPSLHGRNAGQSGQEESGQTGLVRFSFLFVTTRSWLSILHQNTVFFGSLGLPKAFVVCKTLAK